MVYHYTIHHLKIDFSMFFFCHRLFGSDDDRITSFKGQAVETEDWGGSTLDDHHSFIVQYRPTDDKKLGERMEHEHNETADMEAESLHQVLQKLTCHFILKTPLRSQRHLDMHIDECDAPWQTKKCMQYLENKAQKT